MSGAQRSTVLARLAVRVGANVAAGQEVVVLALDVEFAPLAREIADQAYRAGARYVSVLYWDQHVKRSRLLQASEESLDLTPAWWDRHIEECIEKRSAYIVVWGDLAPDLLGDVDPARGARDHMPLTKAGGEMFRSGEVNWTVVPAPSRAAAALVLGADDIDAYWDLLASLLRLDDEDPEAAWRAHITRLRARGAALETHGFSGLRFHGGETDLRLDLLKGARWMPAAMTTNWGRQTIVNMPTEEVFSTPDNRSAEGTVVATRPFQLLRGPVVEGLRLRFERGRVAELEADSNTDAVRAAIAIDDGAARLGEVALVDGTSPVGRTGLLFNDILFDENATCHIALGSAYPFNVPDLPEDPQARAERGFNLSEIHQDIMIGGPTISVDGIDQDGTKSRSFETIPGSLPPSPVPCRQSEGFDPCR